MQNKECFYFFSCFLSLNTLVKQNRKIKPLNFYVCHISETCMGSVLADAHTHAFDSLAHTCLVFAPSVHIEAL